MLASVRLKQLCVRNFTETSVGSTIWETYIFFCHLTAFKYFETEIQSLPLGVALNTKQKTPL